MQGPARKTGTHHALLAGFLGWTLDAFDFFVIVFLYDTLAHEFNVPKKAIVLTTTATLALRPVGALFFGLLADRFGHRALLLVGGTVLLPLTFIILGATDVSPWVSTVLMGISWSLVPAVIWPSTTLIVEPKRLGTALGLITLLQALALWASNRAAGWIADYAGAGPTNPAGYDTMLWYFGLLSLTALTSVVFLWRQETGPRGHGLELARDEMLARRVAPAAERARA